MSRVFPKNSRLIAAQVAVGLLLLGAMATAGVWYYATPKWYRAGYEPVQPITFSHQLHAGQLGLDCRYCHTHVTEAAHANIPEVDTCWKCHGADKGNIKADSPLLAPLRDAHERGVPVPWVRVHKLPDFVYFNHAAHVNRGVGCVSCHGRVDEMAVVRHEKPLSMAWCLECHRNPGPELRPVEKMTDMAWLPGHPESGERIKNESRIRPPTDCTACHR